MHGRILIVDDDPSMCSMLEADLGRRGFTVSWRNTADAALQLIAGTGFDVILTDLRMPGIDGIQLCERIVGSRPDIPVVVITAFGSLDTAVAALRAGAYDFVNKPVELDALAFALDRAVTHRDLSEKVQMLTRKVEESERFDELIGTSLPMQRLFEYLRKIADSDSSVLITGESGTGKELVARSLHRNSVRRDHPWIAFNCAAMPDTLVESELFGHTSGAFTDARASRKGLFLQAEKGTLFLDEIAEMPVSVQPKLLRALEQRTIRPLGSDQEIAVDVRIIAATNRDLETAIDEGRFREDLLYRIDVLRVNLPPLRELGADILLIARRFIEHYAAMAEKPVSGMTQPVSEKLLAYTWPGNVRELRNCIEHAVALAQLDTIIVDDLPEKIRLHSATHLLVGGADPAELNTMEEVERRYIAHVLQVVAENKTRAAQILGFDRKTLYRKMELYGLSHDSAIPRKK